MTLVGALHEDAWGGGRRTDRGDRVSGRGGVQAPAFACCLSTIPTTDEIACR